MPRPRRRSAAPFRSVIVTNRVVVSCQISSCLSSWISLNAVDPIRLTVGGLADHRIDHFPRVDVLGIRREQVEGSSRDRERLRRQHRAGDGAIDPRGVGGGVQQRVELGRRDGHGEFARRAVADAPRLGGGVIVGSGRRDMAAHRFGKADSRHRDLREWRGSVPRLRAQALCGAALLSRIVSVRSAN